MSNLLVQNIKHTNNTTSMAIDTSGQVSIRGEGSATTTNLQQGLAKCWIKADMNTENTVSNSFNTASIVDNATGDYHWNMTNGLSNALGVMSGVTARTATRNLSGASGITMNSSSQWEVRVSDSGGDANSSTADDCEIDVLGHGDLA